MCAYKGVIALAEGKNPKTILEEAIRKRDELNVFIRLMTEALGDGGGDDLKSEGGANAQAERRPAGDPSDPIGVVFPGMFFSKSQKDAAEMFLKQFDKRPMKTKVILQALAKGGRAVGGKNPTANLFSILKRETDTFVLIPKAGWGLVEWYGAATVEKIRREAKATGEDEGQENGSSE